MDERKKREEWFYGYPSFLMAFFTLTMYMPCCTVWGCKQVQTQKEQEVILKKDKNRGLLEVLEILKRNFCKLGQRRQNWDGRPRCFHCGRPEYLRRDC